jgi:hypothetical protein
MAKKVTNEDLFEQGLFKRTVDEAKQLVVALDQVEKGVKDVAVAQKKILNQENNKTIQSVQRTRDAVQQLNEAERIALKIGKQKKSLSDQLTVANSKHNKQIQELRVQIQLQNKATRQQVLENAKIVGSFSALTAKIKRLKKEYKDVAVSEGVASVKAKKLRIELMKLETQVRSVNSSVAASTGNVQRYGSAWSRLGATLKSGLGFIGITGLIFGVARAFKDAFDRVREFDKEMNNLAGIAGTSRDQLKLTEKEIINVAGSSIKTSNEVAKLATSLTALGKSQNDVRRLLKPTNDLSIALKATSDEAGELLVGTLNAFQKGAESGQKFADVIAKMRTSTSLDFERIKDSLGFVSASANTLGLTIGKTGALIGVLQDNNIKAARAGRLLNTSFLRLASKGLTLEQALDKLNKAQDDGVNGLGQLAIAGDLFGKQSASLGVILSKNRDKVAELTNEFDNLSEGALKELTDEQLKSMDAQLKILDSTWERLILNIENGEGVLSDLFTGVIKGATNAIDRIDQMSTALGGFFKRAIGGRAGIVQTFEEISGLSTKFGQDLNSIDAAVDKQTDIIAANFTKKNLKTQKTIANNLKNRIKEDNKLLKNASFLQQIAIEKRISGNLLLLSKLQIVRKEQVNGDEEIIAGNDEKIKQTRTLTGLIEKQAKVVSGLNQEIVRATTEENILKLSIELDVEAEELARLKRIVSSTFQEIDKLERDLIEDSTEKRIANEIAKSEKIIKQIETNSRIEESKKKELIQAENDRLVRFVNTEEVKAGRERIKLQSDLSKAEFEQRRTGFKTEKKFEKEKAKQFTAIRRNAINEEIKLLEQFGGKGSDLRIKQLNAELEGLEELGKGFDQLKFNVGDAVQLIGELIDEAFERRIAKIGEQLEKTGENVDRLREKAAQGQLSSEESIAFERKKEEELEQQRERERKRQVRTQAFFSVLSSFQANDGNLAKTITDIGVLRALAQGFSAFDGVDDTGGRGTVDSKGGRLWTLHPNEQVYSKKDREALGFRTREEVKDIVKMYDSGTLNDLMVHDTSNQFLNPSSFVLNGMSTMGIESKLDELNASVRNLDMGSGTVSIDEVKKVIQYTYKKGNTKIVERSKLRG